MKKNTNGYNVKPKQKHYQVISNMVETDGNKKKSLALAGYSKAIQKNPSKVFESKGFNKAMAQLGLTEELLVSALVTDIVRKGEENKDRLGEITLGLKLHGRLKDTKEGDKTLILNLSSESASRFLKDKSMDT